MQTSSSGPQCSCCWVIMWTLLGVIRCSLEGVCPEQPASGHSRRAWGQTSKRPTWPWSSTGWMVMWIGGHGLGLLVAHPDVDRPGWGHPWTALRRIIPWKDKYLFGQDYLRFATIPGQLAWGRPPRASLGEGLRTLTPLDGKMSGVLWLPSGQL